MLSIDARGNITGVVDGNRNRTEYALDAWGRATEIRKADGSTENYAYDHAGNILSSVDGEGNRKVIGGSPDHDPPLVQRYYEGDPRTGEKPGYLMTADERRTSAKDRSRMKPSTREEQNKQGAAMAKYSKEMKKKFGL